jgi:diketogulonate reductase-like aldo/keto reductase
MKLDWNKVEEELKLMSVSSFTSSDPLTVDTLHGSMWGLNIRFMSLRAALQLHRKEIIKYSLERISGAVKYESNYTKKKEMRRCAIGYGTYGWKYDKALIEFALTNDMLIDTAEGYGYGRVETELGKIINGDKRANVMSKVRRDHMSPTAIFNSIQRSVEKLTVVPHFQIHFPHLSYPDAVKDIATAREAGKIKSIGLSNCSIDMIEYNQDILSESTGDPISFVQMPFNVIDQRIREVFLPYCQANNIYVIAYSPLGQNIDVISIPLIKTIAKKYGATPAQIALSYLLSFKGVIPIPTTNKLEHLKQNIEANDLILDEEDVLTIKNSYDERN